MIETTDLLGFLCKAQKLHIINVTFQQMDEGYEITLGYNWHDDNHWYNKTVFITNEGESTWYNGDYEFHTMNNILDEKLNQQTEKEIKARKRKELIESLTPEQRELLGM